MSAARLKKYDKLLLEQKTQIFSIVLKKKEVVNSVNGSLKEKSMKFRHIGEVGKGNSYPWAHSLPSFKCDGFNKFGVIAICVALTKQRWHPYEVGGRKFLRTNLYVQRHPRVMVEINGRELLQKRQATVPLGNLKAL